MVQTLYTHVNKWINNKKEQKYTLEKSQPIQQVVLRKLGIHTELCTLYLPLYKNKIKWTKDLTITETSRGKHRKNHQCISIVNNFLNRISFAQEIWAITKKWGCLKLKSFCTAKLSITKIKRQPTEWEKMFASYSPDKGLKFTIYK
jgi:hypothetical protein